MKNKEKIIKKLQLEMTTHIFKSINFVLLSDNLSIWINCKLTNIKNIPSQTYKREIIKKMKEEITIKFKILTDFKDKE